MEQADDPIGVYNDFLRATLENETRARTLWNEIDDTMRFEIRANDKHVVDLARCLVLAEWPAQKELPAVLANVGLRENLGG